MKTLKFMLAAATAIGLASASQAVAPLAGSTSFEDGAVPATTVGGYWTLPAGAEEGDYTIITEGLATSRSNGAKLAWPSTTKALNLEGGTDPLLRAVGAEPHDLSTDGDVYVDTLVQFTVTPAGDTVTAGADDKLLVYLKEMTNGVGTVTGTNLVVLAATYSATIDPVTGEPVGDPTFTPTEVNVSSGVADKTWYRLTVKSYLADGVPVFKLYLDGVELTTGLSAGTAIDLGKGVAVFPSLRGTADPTLRSVGFAGSGKVDDLLFTTVDPDVTVVDFTIALAGDMNGFTADPTWTSTASSGTLSSGNNAAVCYALTGEQKADVTYTLVSGQGYSATWSPSDPANGVTADTTYTLTVSQAAAKIGGTDYADFTNALASATAGDTITLYKDATVGASLSTAAGTLDLNGKKITMGNKSASSITFTGTGAKTLKDGDLMGVYHELTITAPEGENLTFDGMTFHASVKPHGSGALFTATGCQFLCDFDKNGTAFTDGSDADVHSYGVMFDSSTLFAKADIVNNYFDQGRRAAVQASMAGDLYFYGNTVVADKLTSRVDGATTRYPALQIISNGGVFIENNTFSGQYLGEAFCVYNKGTYRTTDKPIVFNGNVVSNDVNYLWGIYDVDKSGDAALVDPNLYFGANVVGENVNTTQCIYKTTVDGVDMNGVTYSHTPANLALPTGYTTVYDWAHNDGTTDYFVNDAFANDLTGLADNDVLIAFPGADVSGATLTLNAVVPYKNQWTAEAEQQGTELEPGEKQEFSSEPTPQELEAITIVPSDTVSNALATAGASLSDYTARFETVATYDSDAGKWYAEVVMKAATTNTLQGEVNAGAAAVVGALNARSVSFSATPGFYYWINYGATLSDNLPNNTARVLATGDTVQIDMPSAALGQTAGFFKVKVDIVDEPLQQQGGQD